MCDVLTLRTHAPVSPLYRVSPPSCVWPAASAVRCVCTALSSGWSCTHPGTGQTVQRLQPRLCSAWSCVVLSRHRIADSGVCRAVEGDTGRSERLIRPCMPSLCVSDVPQMMGSPPPPSNGRGWTVTPVDCRRSKWSMVVPHCRWMHDRCVRVPGGQ